jgi:(R,R)-butanediol dehydrogenase / meso-butanediol dehydrogenase / diacetyl reductase
MSLLVPDFPKSLMVGTVLEVGSNVTDIKSGDKVSVYPVLYDGTCSNCLAGHPNLCENVGFYGISGWGGGLSDAVSIDRKNVYRLPPNMTTELGGTLSS